MDRFEGTCVGGPLDKQQMAHWAREKPLYRPVVAFTGWDLNNAPIEAVEIGRYKLNDYEQWHWVGNRVGTSLGHTICAMMRRD